jgi:D-alanyl-lipoteichoic acid acyltransferase DltB (MBOAT superfamily)
MLFNSYEYIFLFLPLCLIIYFILNKSKLIFTSKIFLVTASIFFYSWWNPIYVPLIIGSILFNYSIGSLLLKKPADGRFQKLFLSLGIVGNLSLLGYFKYTDFFISNVNSLFSSGFSLLYIVLPLGISFFTFTQIAYLVDTYKGLVDEYSFMNYSLFVTLFPHLLAGPIIHHKEMMPQFDRIRNKILNYKNLSAGLFLFFLGLFKKVMIADSFAMWADKGYSHTHVLTFLEAWVTSLSYTLQIYYDFSGYTDMAIGSALMFNIRLPSNFNSPYRAVHIQDFWRRWHITLSRFLRDYVYIPMGGNRHSEPKTLKNLMATFLIGGIWHGAGWTFVIWGMLHGLAMLIHRVWQRTGFIMPHVLAWFLTFNFINFTWIFFRAKNFEDALNLIKGMLGLNGIVLPPMTASLLIYLKNLGVQFGDGDWNKSIIIGIPIFIFFSILYKNSNQLLDEFKPTVTNLALTVLMVVTSIFTLATVKSQFIYFNF